MTISRDRETSETAARRPGVSKRSIKFRIDPGLDLIYLAEVSLPSNMECLATLSKPTVQSVTMRAARLELLPGAPCTGPHHGPSLTVLESGNCFVTALSRKTSVASFAARQVHPEVIQLEVNRQPNLLEYLRADSFTIELSGILRRRLRKPLPLRLHLEFEVHEYPQRVAA